MNNCCTDLINSEIKIKLLASETSVAYTVKHKTNKINEKCFT